MGERFENEVPIDLFIANRTDYGINNQQYNSFYEYTFRMVLKVLTILSYIQTIRVVYI